MADASRRRRALLHLALPVSILSPHLLCAHPLVRLSLSLLSVGLFYSIESHLELENKSSPLNSGPSVTLPLPLVPASSVGASGGPAPADFIPVHPPDAPVIQPLVHDPKGLDLLKARGGESYYNPRTRRQHLGAFATTFNSSRYEKIACPVPPDPAYPKSYPMKQVLDNWNPDDNTVPAFHYNSLCYFDYQTELDKAMAYRDAEVPFVVYNTPAVQEVVMRWNSMEYLNEKVGPAQKYTTATSQDNHFMYYSRPDKRGVFKDQQGRPWSKPTGEVKMTFTEWLEAAVENHNKTLEERKHYYFRVSTGGPSHWVFKELTFFQPVKSLFIVSPSGQKGIHCRFGMNRCPCPVSPSSLLSSLLPTPCLAPPRQCHL
jgi:hypothetical protein